jgi:hypothetical protein
LFEDFVEKFLSGGEQEVIKVVKGLSVCGFVHHLVAFGEECIEAFYEEIANFGGRGRIHKYVRVKGYITSETF